MWAQGGWQRPEDFLRLVSELCRLIGSWIGLSVGARGSGKVRQDSRVNPEAVANGKPLASL